MQCQPKREHLAAAALLHLPIDIDILAPRITYTKPTRRGPVRFIEPLFPGYLFASFSLADHQRAIRSAHGVVRILSFGNHTPTVPIEWVAGLRLAVNGPNPNAPSFSLQPSAWVQGSPVIEIPPALPSPGERAEVLDGPFQGLEVVVTRLLPARQRVAILLDCLGRQIEAEIPLGSLTTHDSLGVRGRFSELVAPPTPNLEY